MADDIKQRMRGDMDHQPQIAVGAAIFTGSTLAFQTDALAVDDARGNFHVQGFRRFAFDHAKDVINRQLIADGARLLRQGFFKEHRDFYL